MAASIFGRLLNFFSGFLFRLGSFMNISRKSILIDEIINEGMNVNVKYGTSMIIPLVVGPEWTVKQIKERLEKQLNIPAKKLKIIFAGKQLNDKLQMNECDVGNQTVLNAVCSKDEEDEEENDETTVHHPLVESVLKIQCPQDVEIHIDPLKVHFFVYCGNNCKNISPGKLRVLCSKCKRGTLTVSKDPTCWEDVLLPSRITGICQSEDCSGNNAEFFFRCASHSTNSQDDEKAVALYHVKNNFKAVPCLACTEINQIVLVFPCRNGHVICLDCFRDYCISRLQERNFVTTLEYGYTLPCPVGCEDSFIREVHHFRLLNDEQYSRYQRYGAEDCLLKSGGVLCPQPGCGAGILPDPECTKIVCLKSGGQGCGFVFCRSCLQGFHIGDCETTEILENVGQSKYVLDEGQNERSRWEEATKTTIKGTTKPCPKCRTATERDGGCMHMVCVRSQCGYHWCWVCQTEWTRDCMGAHWFG